MTIKNSSLYCVIILVGTTLVAGCSTKRNTAFTRAYHELTTRYNIYYNADKAYHDMLENQLKNREEDYTTLLPFYPTVAAHNKQLPGGPFDLVVEKTTQAIKEHSISAKPRRDPAQPQTPEFRQWLQQEEFNPFIHKAWLLLGKAHVLNGDYEDALAVFRQIQKLFKQNNNLLTETEIWMLRTYTEMGSDYDAENMLYALQSKTIASHLQELFRETTTARLIHKREYTTAIPWLKKIIEQEKNFTQKKRLQYLLGQIYTLQGDTTMAWQAFEDVKGLSTPAAINRQATLAQEALKEKTTKQVVPNPIETFIVTATPNHPTKEQPVDSTQLSNSVQSQSFQDYHLAYLKRSSFQARITDSISQQPLFPEISTPQPLPTSIVDLPKTREELQKQLEEKAAEALRKKPQTVTNKSREKLLKEREKERKAKLRQREKELRKREREREAAIKQKEKEREQRIRKQQ